MKNLKSLVPDLLLVAGAAGVAYGVWLIYAPAGYIVSGLFGIGAGWLTTQAKA